MIRFLFMDVDGTLTDGSIIISADGELFKSFNVKDGYGITHILREKGIVPVVITGRKSEILERRCAELRITEIYQNVKEKLNFLKEFIDRHGLSEGEIAYIGDDMNDYECMEFLYSNKGLTGCPQDAAGKIKLVSSHICSHDGGKGAVREFIEFLAEQA